MNIDVNYWIEEVIVLRVNKVMISIVILGEVMRIVLSGIFICGLFDWFSFFWSLGIGWRL